MLIIRHVYLASLRANILFPPPHLGSKTNGHASDTGSAEAWLPNIKVALYMFVYLSRQLQSPASLRFLAYQTLHPWALNVTTPSRVPTTNWIS
jgi:hypothetical protein